MQIKKQTDFTCLVEDGLFLFFTKKVSKFKNMLTFTEHYIKVNFYKIILFFQRWRERNAKKKGTN